MLTFSRTADEDDEQQQRKKMKEILERGEGRRSFCDAVLLERARRCKPRRELPMY
jgi:hypothetical protein